MMFAVILYANMRGVRSVDRIMELCQRDLAFIWLTKGQKPKRDAFYDFIGLRCTPEIYTIDSLYSRYNVLVNENSFDQKYKLGEAHMFVIDRLDKVRETIEKTGSGNWPNIKKLSNNAIIEIDGCSPMELLKLMENLTMIAKKEKITFVSGAGKHKPQLHYKECFEIMGKDRNSYSKTDFEATFMRMKEENIESEKGILNRLIRSIQTEGHFGDIKENEEFRRFHYRSGEKVYKGFLMYVIGRNMNKYDRFKRGRLKKYENNAEEKTA